MEAILVLFPENIGLPLRLEYRVNNKHGISNQIFGTYN
jgi:hypothetical protein